MRCGHLMCLMLTGVYAFSAPVPNPKITGPIPVTAKPGDPSHNYIYGSTQANLSRYGYREDEFYVEGLANRYMADGETTATVLPGGPYAYKTRVIVRRPTSAGKFNGTLILEWIGVSAGLDQENDWIWSNEHFMRSGYAYIAVSADARGIEQERGLKKFNPARYGSLNVNDNGKIGPRMLSFDIFSQVAQAAKNPEGVKLLGDLKVKNVIATGHSVAGFALQFYYNSIHPSTGIIDGFVVHGEGGRVRTDLKTPAWKLLAERDVADPFTFAQPDTDFLRTWEVAGAAHADWHLITALESLFKRDLAPFEDDKCDKPPMSRIPSHLVQDALYDWMKLWVEEGKQPPRAPRITMTTVPGGARGSQQGKVARDENGNALGGIRLAQFAVPTATDTGENSGSRFCGIMGSHEPFDAAKLARLYPTHAAYVAAVERVADENLKAGYITKEGAAQMKREAAASKIGVVSR